MKSVLIISYHFPPYNVIASYRPLAFAQGLKELGYEPTVITHPILANGEFDKQVSAVSYDTKEGFKVIRVQIKENLWLSTLLRLNQVPILGKIITLVLILLGHFDIQALPSYWSMKAFLKMYLKKNPQDLIISVFNPHYQVRLPYDLYKIFKTPYILDFRDLWNNRIIHQDYKPAFKEKIEDLVIAAYWEKWLNKSLFFTITSLPWLKKLQKYTKTKGYVITNGYEKELFSELVYSGEIRAEEDSFIISHVGSLYMQQDINVFLKGVAKFIRDYQPSLIIKFIGVRGGRKGEKINPLNGYLPNPKTYIEEYLPNKYLVFSERVPKSEAIKVLRNSHILWFPGFKKSKGTYAGKIFEYLGSRRNILVAPGDESVVDELIMETQAGEIANTPEQVYNFIKIKYDEWLKNRSVTYNGNDTIIENYSRHNQTIKLEKIIHRYLYQS